MTVTFRLDGQIIRYDDEAGVFVSFCPALKLYSQGETEEDAKEALRSTVCQYIQACFDLGTLHKELTQKHNFSMMTPGANPVTSPGQFMVIERAMDEEPLAGHFGIEVPMELVALGAMRASAEWRQ